LKINTKYLVMKALNINNFYLKLLFSLSITAFTFSCRQIPEDEKMDNENISLLKPVSVKIDLQGIEWLSNINDNTLVSENNSWGGG